MGVTAATQRAGRNEAARRPSARTRTALGHCLGAHFSVVLEDGNVLDAARKVHDVVQPLLCRLQVLLQRGPRAVSEKSEPSRVRPGVATP